MLFENLYEIADLQQTCVIGIQEKKARSWYTYDVNRIVAEDLETGITLPISDAYSINGQLGDFSNCSKETSYMWSVDYGKTYLFRIINAVMSAQLFFSIVGHNMTLINQDASYLKPVVTSYILIAPGQTMDVLVIANQSLGQYYMAATHMYFTNKFIYTGYDKTIATAILEYNGDYDKVKALYYPNSTFPPFLGNNAAISFRNKLRSLTDMDVPKNITT
ncbi:hypothetical protein QYF36_005928 [Acer negundo]|nr:hypothetical protein QYF36_005928 [Acer negundo]